MRADAHLKGPHMDGTTPLCLAELWGQENPGNRRRKGKGKKTNSSREL